MKRVVMVLSAMIVSLTLSAQSASDILNMGQYNSTFGTARSAGMAGAFGSLGADAASLNINPAGLGMYHSSEVSFTPMVQVSKYESASTLGSDRYYDQGKTTSMSVANAAAVLNLYNGPAGYDGLTSFNIAVSYNRSNDFRSEQYAYSGYEDRSIGDMFAAQLYGVDTRYVYDGNSSSEPYRDSDPYYWGGILAYNTGLLFDGSNNGITNYSLGYTDDDGNYVGSLATGDLVSPAIYKNIKGSISDYSFAMGAEIASRLYVGMNFVFQDYEYEEYSYYSEVGDPKNIGDLAELRYMQNVKYSGSSFAFKFGVNAEFIDGWRLGAAVHTPSYYTVESEYIAAMDNTFYNDSKSYYQESLYYLQTMKINTPTRFIGSTSFTLGEYAIISADYERIWYDKMKVRDVSYSNSLAAELTAQIASTYKATDNIRLGLEAKANPNTSVRIGYAYYESPYADGGKVGAVTNYTAGIGYRSGGMYVDFAYVNTQQTLPESYYYNDASITDAHSESVINADLMKHNLLLTVGFRF